MKHYLVLKKQFNIVLIGLLVFLPTVFLFADTVSDLNNKIIQNNSNIAQLEQEIKQYQAGLDILSKQKSSLSNSIKELDLTKKKLNVDIAITQNKINQTNLKIKNLGTEIITKEDFISNDNKVISNYIKSANEFEQKNLIETLLSGTDFTSTWNDVDNMSSLNNKIRERIKELENAKTVLVDTRNQTINAKKELLSLQSSLADQKKIIDQNTLEKKKLLAQTKNNESNYQKLLKDRLAKKDAFEKEVRDFESKIKFALDPSKLPSRGVLSWPLDNIYITQLFGKTEAGKRLYANGTHNGVDFRAAVGTPVRAMADGVVMGTGNTDLTCPGASFGKFVFIQYDDGLSSAYGHFSLIKATVGQRVSRGDIVGYSGNTGYSTGPHLHVSVYAAGSVKMESRPSQACEGRIYTMPIAPINGYLDPMYYLPEYKN